MTDGSTDRRAGPGANSNIPGGFGNFALDDGEALKLSEIFKLLGDQTRIRIISVLSGHELCVCDIADAVNMTQSAVSHQLRLMRGMKLVKFRKEGKSVYYSLDDDHVLQLFNQVLEHIKHT